MFIVFIVAPITSYHEPVQSWFQTFTMFWILYAFLWVTPWHLNFIWRRFGTLCMFHLHTPMTMEQSVLKHCHIKFRRRGVTQRKAYNSSILSPHSHTICLKPSLVPFSQMVTSIRVTSCSARRTPSQLHSQQHISTQYDMLPLYPV